MACQPQNGGSQLSCQNVSTIAQHPSDRLAKQIGLLCCCCFFVFCSSWMHVPNTALQTDASTEAAAAAAIIEIGQLSVVEAQHRMLAQRLPQQHVQHRQQPRSAASTQKT
jgi:hypothetical protein